MSCLLTSYPVSALITNVPICLCRPHYERYHQHILPHLAAAYSSDEEVRQQEHGRPWCATNAWERDPCVNGVHVRPTAVSSLDDTLLWASSVVGSVLAVRQSQDPDPES